MDHVVQHQRHDEHALGIGEVPDRQHRDPRLALGREQQPLRIQRLAEPPDPAKVLAVLPAESSLIGSERLVRSGPTVEVIHGDDLEAALETYALMARRCFVHASPTLFNAGTPRPQMSSCFLVAAKDDSIAGIYDTLKQCAQISQSAGGIGLSYSRIRSRGSLIRGTNGLSNGIVPWLKTLDASVAAVNQAVADGIVDAINFSIGGGANPWSDAVSLAFLNATDAGIYIAAAAGNAGPGANTLDHNEPWVGSTAASQTGRNGFSYALMVTGPAPVPANLAPVLINEGSGGVLLSATIPGTTPLRISSAISSANFS